MFESKVYQRRRSALIQSMRSKGQSGIMIFVGNNDVISQGWNASVYDFRQDSAWIYYFGVDQPSWAGIIDIDSGDVKAYANDVDIDDIVWMGPQISVKEMASWAGVDATAPFSVWFDDVKKAMAKGRRVHFLPTLRDYNALQLMAATGYTFAQVKSKGTGDGPHASVEFIQSVIDMRLVKEDCEVEELDKAGEIGYQMHVLARNSIALGAYEDEIAKNMEYFSKANGWGLSFEIILSQHGETLHNRAYHRAIEPGKLLVVDAGIESNTHYTSDHTRTYPTSGVFSTKQKDIYQIVLDCHEFAFSQIKPGISYRDIHKATVRLMLSKLKDLGLVHGDLDEMAAKGIGGLFMPHGLGHNMGIDVHDMEEYGEDLVGYDPDQTRAKQLGLGNLRMARLLRPGHVITDEPGIYFIPALIEKFKKEGLGYDFVNYQALEGYYDFGGIRIEDDVLVTADGARRIGYHRLPATVEDIEAVLKK